MTREPTDSLLSGNVEYSDDIKYSLISAGDVTKNKESNGKFKDDYMFLLNEVKSNFHDKPREKYTDKQKYEQEVSECKKWRSLI